MEQPNVPNRFTVEINGIKVRMNILAFRKLTTEEKTDQIDSFLRDKRAIKILKNYKGQEITIPTIYGYDDPINPFNRF